MDSENERDGIFLSDLIESRENLIDMSQNANSGSALDPYLGQQVQQQLSPFDINLLKEGKPELKNYVEGQGDMSWLINEYIEQNQLNTFEVQHVSFLFGKW